MGRHFEVRAASMAKTAAAKSRIYSRYGKEIYLAAKNGTPDPSMNVALRRVIAQAKSNQVPTDVINRAIDKAKGSSQEDYQSVRYEGFGPSGSTLLIDCLTDNTNRSLSDIRTCFNKVHFKMGQAGSVSFSYRELAMIVFEEDLDVDELLLQLLDYEIEVIELTKENNQIQLQVAPEQLHLAQEAIEKILAREVTFLAAEITLLANDEVTLADEQEKADFQKLVDLLNEVDDVQNIYHNVANLDE